MKTLKDLTRPWKGNDNIAIIDRKEFRRFTYTYDEFYNLARKFGTILKKNNIKKGDKILIWSYNGAEYATILFGAYMQGVVVVPIDLRSNVEFPKKVAKEVNAKAIFQTRYKPKIRGLKTIFIENFIDVIDEQKPAQMADVKDDDIAEILYTSGTTGHPKGVILTHKNFVSNIKALNSQKQVDDSYKFLSLLPLSHVFEQTVGLYVPVSNHACVTYIPTLKARAIHEACYEEKITAIIIVPRLLDLLRKGLLNRLKEKGIYGRFEIMRKMLKYLPLEFRQSIKGFFNKHTKYLNFFVCGGAPLPAELENFYYSLGMQIMQGYGLTETSPVLTSNTINSHKVSSIGKPLSNVKLKITKEGELLARGPSMTKGYYKRPQKTKELFQKGWLKTGDLAYVDEEGFYFLKGRQKDMIVTSSGMNVYAKDIEDVLNKIPGVKESCVLGMEHKTGEEIHAVLILKKNANAKKIIDAANKKLDAAQQIKYHSVWPHEDFPRTTTLKIRKFLVKEQVKNKSTSKEKLGLKSKVERALSKLTTKKITKGSTLKSLGLSSMDIVDLISILEQEYNMDIDDDSILVTTKVGEIEKLILHKKKIEKRKLYRKWALGMPCRILRFLVQNAIIFPVVSFFSRPKVEGLENLEGYKGPMIFAANHTSHFDAPIIMKKLPARFRNKIAAATFQEYFFNNNRSYKSFGAFLQYYLLTASMNIFPMPHENGFRRALRHTGKLIDKGWNILIFPEGKRTYDGKMNPFQKGTGMLAVETNIPVVPIKVEGLFDVLPRTAKFPKFHDSKVKIGKPLYLKHDSYLDAINKIEKAVKEL